MRRPSLFILLTLLLILTLVACGGTPDTSSPDIDGESKPTAEAEASEPNDNDGASSNDSSEAGVSDSESDSGIAMGDVSGYTGTIIVQAGIGEIYRWTLSTQEAASIVKIDQEAETLVLYVAGTSSYDGKTFAYVENTPFQLEQTVVMDIASGTKTRIPSDGGETTIFSSHPAPSDVSTVVFVHQPQTMNPENAFDVQSGNRDIALWDGESMRLLTDDEADDTTPLISADGQTVIFLSTRDRSDGDFYRISLSGDNTPTRISIENDAAISGIKSGGTLYRMTADGSRILFVATLTEGGDALYMMDTADGALTRITTPEGLQISAFDISGDGTLVAFSGIDTTDPLNQPLHTVSTATPTEVTTFEGEGIYGGIAVNHDGSAIATVLTNFNSSDPYQLLVMRADGSDARTVSSDANLIAVLGGGRYFFRGN